MMLDQQTADSGEDGRRSYAACVRCGSPRIVTIRPARPGPDGWGERCKDCGHVRDISAEARAAVDAMTPVAE